VIRLMKRAAPFLGAAFVVGFVLWHVSPLVNEVTFDESNLVYDATRLLQGQVPYRDFFCFLPPGVLYVLAGNPLVWAGRPETGERYFVVLCVLAATAIIWLTLRRRAVDRQVPVGAMAAVFPICLFPFAAFSVHHWLAVLAYLSAIAAAARLWEERGGRWAWIWLGVLTGLSGCCLQTEGVFAAILALMTLLGTSPDGAVLGRRSGLVLSGALGIGALLLGPLVALGAGPLFLRDAVTFLMVNYNRVGNLNNVSLLADLPLRLQSLWRFEGVHGPASGLVRALSGSLLYASILLLATGGLVIAAAVLARSLKSRRMPPVDWMCACVLTIFTLGAFNVSGPGWVHLIYLSPPLIFLWELVLVKQHAGNKQMRAVGAALWILLALGVLFHGTLAASGRFRTWGYTDVDRVDRESRLNRYLRTSGRLGPGDSLVVLPTGGNVYLYTYPAAIGYTYFFPLSEGYHDLKDHAIAAAEIARNRPRIILIHKTAYGAFLDPRSPVAKVLEERYRVAGSSPAVIMLQLRSEGPQGRKPGLGEGAEPPLPPDRSREEDIPMDTRAKGEGNG
jgi:hypothetical protein